MDTAATPKYSHGGKRVKLTPTQTRSILTLRADGRTQQQIATAIGISQTGVSKCLRDLEPSHDAAKQLLESQDFAITSRYLALLDQDQSDRTKPSDYLDYLRARRVLESPNSSTPGPAVAVQIQVGTPGYGIPAPAIDVATVQPDIPAHAADQIPQMRGEGPVRES